MSDCSLCRRIEEIRNNPNHPFLVKEFSTGYLLVGDHQLFPGYALLVFKSHVREFHDLDAAEQNVLTQEISNISKASLRAFGADKINIGSYGNMTPHLHWHVFPRVVGDVAWPKPPWVLMDQFEKHATSEKQASEVAEKLRTFLKA